MTGSQLRAHVWWCGDECDCCQARIDQVWAGKLGSVTLWEGTFRTDGEWAACNAELNRAAKVMRRHWHDAYRAIEWPWDRGDR